ncbi:HP1184 family multidrug efflux MATE transporter [Helicobacter pylori]|uniref:HP1184 family multidrug efflux MATE transporter n=1 Tax=Helicobacter pylori TaxID=210 RepID=UPI001CC3DD44|nr:HP1184 family multidrug efflux MATE transporter [Helicobacter pylori]WRD59969.1 HP1184 family multidrug efflux MATE transporter [Helicobacter pylori]WRD84225.1 HP1184 family multidrug efflux MATE transporter [Helicobacter pylori]BDA08742.1 membrane protein [Helicobacter pylori]
MLKKKIDLHKDSIRKLFFYYFIPLAFSMISLSTYSMIDGMFVGKKLGKEAIAAVNIAWPIFPGLIAYELLFGFGAASIVGYFLGQNKTHRARLVFSSVFYFVAISVFILSMVLLPFSETIARLFGSNDALLGMSKRYIEIILMGAVFMVLHPLADVFVVNDKRPILAMVAMLIGSLANIFFNYLFIFVLEVGVQGSAIATVIGHAIGVLVLMQHFWFKKGQLYFIKRFSLSSVISSAKSGVPQSTAEFSASVMILLFNTAIMHTAGERFVSVYGIVMYNAIIFFTTLFAVSQGIQPIASFSYGARNLERVKEVFVFGLKVAFCIGIVFYGVYYFLDEFLIKLYLQPSEQDPLFMQETKRAMNIYYVGYVFLGMTLLCAVFFQSIQRTKSSFIITLSHTLGFMVILLPILSHFYGINGVWVTYPIAQFLAFLVALGVTYYEIKKGVFTTYKEKNPIALKT